MSNSNFVVQNGLTTGFTTIDAASGNINTGGSVTASNFVGSGALLTGIAAGSTYSDSNVASYLSAYSGTLTASVINSDNHNYANGTSIISTLSTATATANTAMKGYVDGQITTVNGTISTANTAMKGYADAITTAWTANAAVQVGQIATTTSAITTANTAMKGYVDGQITNLVGGAPAILDTLSEIATALGNDANLSVTLTNTITTANTIQSNQITTVTGYITAANAAIATKAPIASPTFTGIATAPTFVGALTGNASGSALTVTQAAQTAITSVGTLTALTVSGAATFQQSTEVLNAITSATGTVTHDFSTGAIWYHSSIAANFTANFTNVSTTNNRTIVITLFLSQGATAYIPNAVQIAGTAQTIKWAGGSAPTGNASKVDQVSFTLIQVASAWVVLGILSTYG